MDLLYFSLAKIWFHHTNTIGLAAIPAAQNIHFLRLLHYSALSPRRRPGANFVRQRKRLNVCFYETQLDSGLRQNDRN